MEFDASGSRAPLLLRELQGTNKDRDNCDLVSIVTVMSWNKYRMIINVTDCFYKHEAGGYDSIYDVNSML